MPITINDPINNGWKPLNVNLEFATRDELGMFLDMMSEFDDIARMLTEPNKTSDRTEHLNASQKAHILDNMVPLSIFNHLSAYHDKHAA